MFCFLKQLLTKKLIFLSNFKNKQSYGYDGVDVPLVKSVISSNNIVQPLTYICKKSFESAIFLDEMKIVKIVPLFKNGNRKDTGSKYCI